MTRRLTRGLASSVLAATLAASASGAAESAQPSEAFPEHSLTELNEQLTNPVSELWSIAFQQNNFRIDPGPGQGNCWSSNLLFQPVLPLAITPECVSLVVLDQRIDMATPSGKLLFHVLGAIAEFERGLIRERTFAGLAAARALCGPAPRRPR